MTSTILRRRNLLKGSVAVGAVTTFNIETSGARAAEFNFKLGSYGNNKNSLTIRLTEMCEQIKKESNGRLSIQFFPNSTLGNDTSMMSQLHSGAMHLMSCAGSTLSGLLPKIGMDGIGFAFANSDVVYKTFDGPLGAYLRNMMNDADINAFPKACDVGLRWITTSNRAIRNAADLRGLKIRVPPAQITVDLFRTLGAAPTALNLAELYTAMQSAPGGCAGDAGTSVIYENHFYEVQKFLCRNQSPGDVVPGCSTTTRPSSRCRRICRTYWRRTPTSTSCWLATTIARPIRPLCRNWPTTG